jgi:ElaA protein
VTAPRLHAATLPALPPTTLYALLRLRVDVFVVEQTCPYPELDGRDLEPDAWHLWLADAAPDPAGAADPAGALERPIAYLRLLTDPDGVARIGRVCVAPDARKAGHASTLMTAALARVGTRPCRLDAQSHLVGFYRGFGFHPAGPEYLEDGIPHTPMHRPGP